MFIKFLRADMGGPVWVRDEAIDAVVGDSDDRTVTLLLRNGLFYTVHQDKAKPVIDLLAAAREPSPQ